MAFLKKNENEVLFHQYCAKKKQNFFDYLSKILKGQKHFNIKNLESKA